MKKKTKEQRDSLEGLFIALLPINVVGICGFWLLYLAIRPSLEFTPGLFGTFLAEMVTAVFCMIAFVAELGNRSFAPVLTPIAAGMLFFGSIQGIGDAISSQTYVLIMVMGINIVVIPLRFAKKKGPLRREAPLHAT